MVFLFIIIIFFLSFSNGANDNFKGVATIWGSRTLNFRSALLLANASTFLGSVMATVLGYQILRVFSGKGLVPDFVLQNSDFATAFALGAGGCVFLATVLRLPISTTHALLGALAGAGAWFAGSQLSLAVPGPVAAVPLLVSPFLAAGLTFLTFNGMRGASQITSKFFGAPWPGRTPALAHSFSKANEVIDRQPARQAPIGGRAEALCGADYLHILSGCLVCFSRGVNDTPKIASLLLLGSLTIGDTFWAFMLVAGSILLGGAVFALRVATTMSQEITDVPRSQGLVGNLVTAMLVLFASKLGMPVSTTHVAVGSLIGIGVITRAGHWTRISQILFSWLLTIPCAFCFALLAGAAFSALGPS